MAEPGAAVCSFGLAPQIAVTRQFIRRDEFRCGEWLWIIDWYRIVEPDVTANRLSELGLEDASAELVRDHPRGLAAEEWSAEWGRLSESQLRGLNATCSMYRQQPTDRPARVTSPGDLVGLPAPCLQQLLGLAGELAMDGPLPSGMLHTLDTALTARNSGATIRRMVRNMDWAVKLRDPAIRAEVWNWPAMKRGTAIEGYLAFTDYGDWYHIGAERGGTFPSIDFWQDNNLVSLKTVDPHSPTWAKRMLYHITTDLAAVAEQHPTMSVTLDIRLPPGSIAAASPDLVRLQALGRENRVIVAADEF